ncbi:Nif3-like dinuclear metal center hexameric protein [Marinilabilia rubra]|uniref:GTP cyclohydrolase 1 type 2 homolog n=1 Tax=Marinilabilia rubra TaxID=2162893 RepID=A0A2U2BA53_9BACT|nr:Nif3-like dinuclear metal center hexameric protein [Marinilabilia rubra]PWD99916.1 Nif3-like dinuclear metal center hexameric protein [Marinilabilia rubra]
MVQLKHIIKELETFAPPAFQENYDNSGLQAGDPGMEIQGILTSLDVTEEIVNEAIDQGANLIVAHHPLSLKGFKTITGQTAPERILIKAIKNDIAIYSAHTNIDSIEKGVSGKLAKKLGLTNVKVLQGRKDLLVKLVTFVPADQAEDVREAIFNAGAGVIGNYDSCSYNLEGQGSFRAGENTNPFVGEKEKLHFETEVRIETILPEYLKGKVIAALKKAHPYEEVAYDLYPLSNQWDKVGFGAVGELNNSIKEIDFFDKIKEITGCGCIRHTRLLDRPIKRVAVCGGSGSFLLEGAISAGADLFISADFKYHQFQEADNKIVIADIGHYESEQFTKEVFFELLTKKFPNFAVRLSNVSTNPIKYY